MENVQLPEVIKSIERIITAATVNTANDVSKEKLDAHDLLHLNTQLRSQAIILHNLALQVVSNIKVQKLYDEIHHLEDITNSLQEDIAAILNNDFKVVNKKLNKLDERLNKLENKDGFYTSIEEYMKDVQIKNIQK